MSPATASSELRAAKSRLDGLRLYPTPVRIDHVRLLVRPLVFRLPFIRRFDGFATHRRIYLRRPPDRSTDLVVHELCHVWQMQHRPIRMPLSYLLRGYRGNPYEIEARRAARSTR